MSIRIHKFLGYGLTDIESDNCKITDPRINPNSPLLDVSSTFADEDQLDDYANWLGKHSSL
jgi:hypothetical protein